MTGQPRDRIVTGNISLSLDGRVTGPAGDHDMGWIVPHALTSESRAHLLKITSTASTALLGRKNYQGFAGFWPAVAGDEGADPRDRTFARWLNEAEKVVVSRTLTEASWPGSRVVADDPAEVVDPADDPSGLPAAYPRRLLHCIHSDPRHLLGWSPEPSITPNLLYLTSPYKKHAVLCHYAHLLRQLGPSSGSRVHDRGGRRARPSPPPARRGSLLPDGHR